MRDPEPISMSLDEFLVWEPKQPMRYEFSEGHVFAMAGGSRAHGTIASNLVALIRPALRGRNCGVYVADMKLAVPDAPAIRYPDLVVTCDPRDMQDDQLTRFPILLIEIVSGSTEMLDRGVKFAEYRSIPSLEEFVLVDSRTVHVETFRRREVTKWLFEEIRPGEEVRFESIGLSLPIEALYEDLNLTRVDRITVD
ncbi:MAG TPA: Uma2 family endonuclease [Candidatus Limnocylindrales bacterium]|nr:Uma2 family endonuclease [Candidatus Limnocylindrales bacterium]